MNRTLLIKAIDQSGLKKSYIQERLGLSDQGFYNKLNGKTDWWRGEVEALTEIMNLTDEQQKEIFFASEVE